MLSNQKQRFEYSYTDAFAGPGEHRRKKTGEIVLGSPREVLAVQPPFHRYYFIDFVSEKVDYLRQQIGPRTDVDLHVGDTNIVLLRNAISIGGDSDTVAAIAGPVAEALFGIPESLQVAARRRVTEAMAKVLDELYAAAQRRISTPEATS